MGHWIHISRALSVAALVLSSPGTWAQDGMEVFEEVDPYTKGDPEVMAKLGYVKFGPFRWTKTAFTGEVCETLGNPPALWVETAHFRIGSTLGTYRPGADRLEREKIKLELARLKKKLGRARFPKKDLDPWLRLHLYAQRAEDLYSQFQEDFELEPADFEDKGEFLGVEHKFLLLLCQRKSELGRYIRAEYDRDPAPSWRWGTGDDGGVFLGLNAEDIASGWSGDNLELPFDTFLHVHVIGSLTANLLDNYLHNRHTAPRWMRYGLAHRYVRAVDARWVELSGTMSGATGDEDAWKWAPRVLNLVKNDFFVSASDMFGWQASDELKLRDHMIVWSKLEYLLDECEGNHAAFLNAVCEGKRQDDAGGRKTQAQALQAHFDLAPAEFDEVWSKWVKKVYKKR